MDLAGFNLLLACVEAPSIGRGWEYGRFFGGMALPLPPTQASSGVRIRDSRFVIRHFGSGFFDPLPTSRWNGPEIAVEGLMW